MYVYVDNSISIERECRVSGRGFAIHFSAWEYKSIDDALPAERDLPSAARDCKESP